MATSWGGGAGRKLQTGDLALNAHIREAGN